jgi:hypothetical protein
MRRRWRVSTRRHAFERTGRDRQGGAGLLAGRVGHPARFLPSIVVTRPVPIFAKTQPYIRRYSTSAAIIGRPQAGMALTQQPAPLKVFISYSHDSAEHQARVLGLSDRLRADGVDAEVDQYNAAPPEGWPLWCEQQIEAADFVLMVCTESYHHRIKGDERPGQGLGVVWEAGIIRQLLYDAGALSDKFVPVLFSDGLVEHVPTLIRGRTRYVVDTEDGYDRLLRQLSGQPSVVRPVLGPMRPLPARRRQWLADEPPPTSVAPPAGRTVTASGAGGGERAYRDDQQWEGGAAASARRQKAPQTRGGWQRYIKDPADLKIGIAAGLLFVVVVVLLQRFASFRQDPDFVADYIVPYMEGVVQHQDQVKAFVFVNIDDQTYREWQQPLFTPRDKLAALIDTIAKSGLSAIIVDIDLSRASDSAFVVETGFKPGFEPKSCGDLGNAHDRSLCTVIIDASKRVPIILARNFNIGAREPESGGPLRPLPSFLDPVFETGPLFGKADSGSDLWASPEYPNVFWASPLYNLDEERTIRHWRLWEPACVGSSLIAMPSVQLLVATLVRNASPEVGLKHLKEHLLLKDEPKCSEPRPQLREPSVPLIANAKEPVLDLSDTSFGQRIVYTLNKETGLRATVPIAARDSGDMHPAQQEEVPILRVISAKDLAPGPPLGVDAQGRKLKGDTVSIDPDIFRERIVVIGASHHESGDNHLTPMGLMPGALVNINAIHTLFDYGQLQPAPWYSRILVSGAIVSVIALLFHVLNSSIAGFLSIFVLFISLVFVNHITLSRSILFDLSMAGLLYLFYKLFVIGFFHVFKKGWKVKNIGWRVWEWRIRNEKGMGWKALLATRYQNSEHRDPRPLLFSAYIFIIMMAGGLAVGLLSTAAASEVGDRGRVAAVVEQIIGNGNNIWVQVRRSGGDTMAREDRPLALLQQLQAGDHVIIESPNSAVVLSLVGAGNRRTIMQEDSPFEVPPPGSPPSLWRNLGHEVIRASMEFISSLWSEKQSTTKSTIAAISRGGETGGELRAPIFQLGAQRVVAGERTLTFAWEGGEPAYMVDIKREGSADPIARVEGLPSPELPPTGVHLLPGRHSIIIRDRDNAHILQHAFEVVDASLEPSPGDPSPFTGLPHEAGTTLAAVWLAAQEGGAWSLESVQQVDDLARTAYQPAMLLRDRLLFDGRGIKLPTETQ